MAFGTRPEPLGRDGGKTFRRLLNSNFDAMWDSVSGIEIFKSKGTSAIIDTFSNSKYVILEVPVGMRSSFVDFRSPPDGPFPCPPTGVLHQLWCKVQRLAALRWLLFGGSGGSSSHSKESARAVVSIGSNCGISSATEAPSSANFRADTKTRLSSDPTAWL